MDNLQISIAIFLTSSSIALFNETAIISHIPAICLLLLLVSPKFHEIQRSTSKKIPDAECKGQGLPLTAGCELT